MMYYSVIYLLILLNFLYYLRIIFNFLIFNFLVIRSINTNNYIQLS